MDVLGIDSRASEANSQTSPLSLSHSVFTGWARYSDLRDMPYIDPGTDDNSSVPATPRDIEQG